MSDWSVVALSPPPSVEVGRFPSLGDAQQAVDSRWGKKAPAPQKAGAIPAGARISEWRDDRMALLSSKAGAPAGEALILESRHWDAQEPPLVLSRWRWSLLFGFESTLVHYMAESMGLEDELIGRTGAMRHETVRPDPKALEAYSRTWTGEVVPWAAAELKALGVDPSTYSGDRIWPADVRALADAAEASAAPWGAHLAASLRRFAKDAADGDEGTYAKLFKQEGLKWTFQNAVWRAFCWVC